MSYLNRRRLRVPLIAFVSAVILLGAVAPASAATTETTTVTKFTIEFDRLSPPPFTQTNVILVDVTAYQTSRFTFGTIDVFDVFRNVRIHGYIKTMTPIAGGFQFEGCGRGAGSVNTKVCFVGAGQHMPQGSNYDYFSIGLTSGGTYTISGHVPVDSVDTVVQQ